VKIRELGGTIATVLAERRGIRFGGGVEAMALYISLAWVLHFECIVEGCIVVCIVVVCNIVVCRYCPTISVGLKGRRQ